MAVKLFYLCLSLGLLCLSQANEHEHRCRLNSNNCDECIQAVPECAWCTQLDITFPCNTAEGLRKAQCHKRYIYNPKSTVQVVRNESKTGPAEARSLFLQPQELSLHLRLGVSQSFPLTITMNTDQPVTDLIMDTSPVPPGVNITFSNITNGNPLDIQVNVEANECPSDDSNQMQNSTGPWSIHITPRGFSLSVKLHLTLECQCDCKRFTMADTNQCPEALYDLCRSSPTAQLCSGRGSCVMGDCVCNRRPNPNERYTGRFCECSNFDCPHYNNRLCGGHGICECGRCICDRDWTGDDCGCSMETASCMATNNQLCNGRGRCLCGECECDPQYAGPTCEDCPFCPGFCTRHKECVECLAFGTGRYKDRCDDECGHLNLTMVDTLDDISHSVETGRYCRMRRTHDSCFISYFIHTSSKLIFVVRDRHCRAKSDHPILDMVSQGFFGNS